MNTPRSTSTVRAVLRNRATGPTMVIAVGVVLAFIVPPFTAHSMSLWIIYGLLALSFTFVWGHGGIFSLGQAAFFGLGGYAYGAAAINIAPTTGETITSLVVAVLAGGLAAAILGYFVFWGNIGDVYLAVIMIATTLALLTVFTSTADPSYRIGNAAIGGYNGMVGIPGITIPGIRPSSTVTLVVVVVVAAGIGFGIAALLRRPFGRVLTGIRENEFRIQLLGYDVRVRKLIAFAIGGMIAGAAGGLYAAWGNFISPQVFSLQQAALVAIWTLVGGRRSLIGAFVGAFAVQGLSGALGSMTGGAIIPIVLGLILLAVVLFLPGGVFPAVIAPIRRLIERRTEKTRPVLANHSPNPAAAFAWLNGSALSLRADNIAKRFGGLTVLRDVHISVDKNRVRTLIGPNGAGKSTFFNLLIGRYRPTSGEIYLGDKRITRLRPDQRARLGVGIKTQVPSIFRELTVRENVWIAAWGSLRNVSAADERTTTVLRGLGLESRKDEPAGALAHGQQQWLEIGLVVARAPRVILLDEPTAGMTRTETHQYVELIKVLSQTTTVVVVEHDMEFVRELKAPVTMFHNGVVFAEGSIDDLRADDRVLDVYLGRAATTDA